MAKDSPESKSEILKLAAEHLRNENPGKAIKLLEGSELTEGDAELQHMLATAYADRKWGKKAIAQYRKCLSAENNNPALIQEFAEYMLDSEEHKALAETLYDILDRKETGRNAAAMCLAMLYSALGDCLANDIKTGITTDYLKTYAESHPGTADAEFFTSVVKYMSETPNDLAVTQITDSLLKIMVDKVPSILGNLKFQSAVADFEISLILYSNTVNPLTLLGMRTAKLKFASSSDDRDYLKYLVFDAKMAVVDVLRNSSLDTDSFASACPYLWSQIAGFVNGAVKTPDLKKFARDEIYSGLKGASPHLMDILKSNLSADGFAALKEFISSPAQAPKPAVFSGNKIISRPKTVKVSPNEPCPCGSGKKYKKCCGLK